MRLLCQSGPMDHDRLIRDAETTDVAAMLDIYTPIVRDTAISFEIEAPTQQDLAGRLERITATDPWLVLEHHGELAGYAYSSSFRARPAYATTRETTVYVHPDHHGQGVGRALMAALLDEITERGARLAVAVIALPNEASIALHEALGFTGVGTLHDVARKFDTWWNEGFWELRLPRNAPHP